MGAFLIRFPKLKIRLVWLFDFGLFGFWPLWVRAYWLLPAMGGDGGLLREEQNGAPLVTASPHRAHVGGFMFGALAAVGLRYSGLEQQSE